MPEHRASLSAAQALGAAPRARTRARCSSEAGGKFQMLWLCLDARLRGVTDGRVARP